MTRGVGMVGSLSSGGAGAGDGVERAKIMPTKVSTPHCIPCLGCGRRCSPICGGLMQWAVFVFDGRGSAP